MNVEDYILRYGYTSWQFILSSKCPAVEASGKVIVKTGLLHFNEETSHAWAGPFEGGYAYFKLCDYTNCKLSFGMFIEHGDMLHKKCLDDLSIQMNLPRSKRYSQYKHKSKQELQELLEHYPFDMPTTKKPIKLYMSGNDDTSYSKFFETVEQALEEVALLEACQPLDIFKDILNGPYSNHGWVFTN